jgi:hypothetical protein
MVAHIPKEPLRGCAKKLGEDIEDGVGVGESETRVVKMRMVRAEDGQGVGVSVVWAKHTCPSPTPRASNGNEKRINGWVAVTYLGCRIIAREDIVAYSRSRDLTPTLLINASTIKQHRRVTRPWPMPALAIPFPEPDDSIGGSPEGDERSTCRPIQGERAQSGAERGRVGHRDGGPTGESVVGEGENTYMGHESGVESGVSKASERASYGRLHT